MARSRSPGNHAVAGRPHGHSLHRRLGGNVVGYRRPFHRMPRHELVNPPDIVGIWRTGKRRTHGNDLGDMFRAAFGNLAREYAAKTPADEHDLLAILLTQAAHPRIQRREILLRRAEIETQPPALHDMPGHLQLLRHVAHALRMGAEAGQQHHYTRYCRAGQVQCAAKAAPEGFGKVGQLCQQQTRRRAVHSRRCFRSQQFGSPGNGVTQFRPERKSIFCQYIHGQNGNTNVAIATVSS
jgi:hypothetical protein